ncbi:MAG: hypothetical protein AB7O96_05585 [Pseudobdellovibrionaceae bacterium]
MHTTLEINKVVKSAIKSQGLTYPLLAKRLHVSVPTIKRWLRSEGLSVQQWLEFLSAVGLSLSDVASAISEPSADQFEYTEKQETLLAETPGVLAFFQSLLSGETPVEIQKTHGLSKQSIIFYLKKLDEISLVVWTEGLACKLKVRGEPKWKKGGPLAKKFRDRLLNDFIWPRKNEDCFRLGIYEVTKKDCQELAAQVGVLFETAKNMEKKARLLKIKTETTCIGTCLDYYSPEFLSQIPERNKK